MLPLASDAQRAQSLPTAALKALPFKDNAGAAQVRDLHTLPPTYALLRLQFKRRILDQLLASQVTVDDAWGVLEELSLKKTMEGRLSAEDSRRVNRSLDQLQHVGLAYVPARPEWDLPLQGVLQMLDPDRLVDCFPALQAWGGRNRFFTLLRSRRHEFN